LGPPAPGGRGALRGCAEAMAVANADLSVLPPCGTTRHRLVFPRLAATVEAFIPLAMMDPLSKRANLRRG